MFSPFRGDSRAAQGGCIWLKVHVHPWAPAGAPRALSSAESCCPQVSMPHVLRANGGDVCPHMVSPCRIQNGIFFFVKDVFK